MGVPLAHLGAKARDRVLAPRVWACRVSIQYQVPTCDASRTSLHFEGWHAPPSCGWPTAKQCIQQAAKTGLPARTGVTMANPTPLPVPLWVVLLAQFHGCAVAAAVSAWHRACIRRRASLRRCFARRACAPLVASPVNDRWQKPGGAIIRLANARLGADNDHQLLPLGFSKGADACGSGDLANASAAAHQ